MTGGIGDTAIALLAAAAEAAVTADRSPAAVIVISDADW